MTHCISTVVASSAFCITGNATFTTEPSTKASVEPRIDTTRVHLGAAVGFIRSAV